MALRTTFSLPILIALTALATALCSQAISPSPDILLAQTAQPPLVNASTIEPHFAPLQDIGARSRYFSQDVRNRTDTIAIRTSSQFTTPLGMPYLLSAVNLARSTAALSLGISDTVNVVVYISAVPFDAPNFNLRGRSFSSTREVFILLDDTTDDRELHYVLAHELTHVLAWNRFGRPASTMLSEGLAVYGGQNFLIRGKYLAPRDLCLALQRIDALPSISSSATAYEGHILSLDAYYAAGCFVEYLIQTYGIQKLRVVYPTGHFEQVFGKSAAQLESAWHATLAADQRALSFEPQVWADSYRSLRRRYLALFRRMRPTSADFDELRDLNLERVSLMRGVTPQPAR